MIHHGIHIWEIRHRVPNTLHEFIGGPWDGATTTEEVHNDLVDKSSVYPDCFAIVHPKVVSQGEVNIQVRPNDVLSIYRIFSKDYYYQRSALAGELHHYTETKPNA